MIPNIKSTFFVVIIALLVSRSYEQKTINNEISAMYQRLNFMEVMEDFINSTSVNPSSSKYYTFLVEEIIPEEDIAIELKPLSYEYKPELLYLIDGRKVQDKQTLPEIESKYLCMQGVLEVCYIPWKNITSNRNYYFSVSCSSFCAYSLKVTYQKEKKIKAGDNFLFNFVGSIDPKVLKIFIPDLPNIDHFIAWATYVDGYYGEHTYTMKIFKGNQVLNDLEVTIPVENWFGGKGFALKKGDGHFCTNCNFTVLIEPTNNTIIRFYTEAFGGGIRDLQFKTPVHDVLQQNDTLYYNLTISYLQKLFIKPLSFSFVLQPFSGKPSISVTPDRMPNELQYYRWKYPATHEKTEIILTPIERDDANAKDEVYFIAVHADVPSSFELHVVPKNTNVEMLEFGVQESGIVIDYEIIQYKLSVLGDTKVNITLDLISQTGNADLYVTLCGNTEHPCQPTWSNFEKRNTTPASKYFAGYSDTPGKSSLEFETDPVTCKDDQNRSWLNKILGWFGTIFITECVYNIAVVGNSNKQRESAYSLIARKGNDLVILYENTQYRQSLDEGQEMHYQFTLPHHQNNSLKSVVFQLTTINGELIVDSSRNSSNKKISYFDMDIIRYDRSTEGDLSGDYRLNIKAKDRSYYTMIVLVERDIIDGNKNDNNGNNKTNNTKPAKPNLLKIFDGVPQKVSFDAKQNDTIRYFELNATMSNSNSDQIELNLNHVMGRFGIYMTKGDRLPEEGDYDWMSKNNSLIIKSNDGKLSSNGKYLVLVKLIKDDKDNSTFAEYGCMIQWNRQFTSNLIVIGQSYFEKITPEAPKYFSFIADKDSDLEVDISSYIQDQHALTAYISVSNKYPSNSSYDYKINGWNSSLDITKKEIENNCNNKKKGQVCMYYVGLRTTAPTFFTLRVKERHDEVMLLDGVPLTIGLDNKTTNDSLFYAYVSSEKVISLTTYSAFRGIVLLVNILQVSTVQNQTVLKFPNSTQHHFSSVSNNSASTHSINIKPEAIKTYCPSHNSAAGSKCLMTVRASPSLKSYYSFISKPTFKIMYSTDIKKLMPGVALNDYVEEFTYKYYMLYVGQEQNDIHIAVTPFGNSDPDVVVSKGMDARPTLEDFEWASRSFKAEKIEISSKLKNGTVTSLIGFYVIGIFGFQNSSYSIVASVGNFRLYEILPGQPMDLSLDEGETVYLEYFNRYNTSFMIMASQFVGTVETFVKAIPNMEANVLLNLPEYSLKTSFNEIWTNKLQGNREMVIVRETDKTYCSECRFIIGLYAKMKSHTTISIHSENVMIALQSSKTIQDYVEKGHSMKFSYSSHSGPFEITIIIYSGQLECLVNQGLLVNKDKYLKKLTQASKDSKIIHEIVDYYTDQKTSNLLGSRYFTLLITGIESSNYSITLNPVTNYEKNLRYGIVDFNYLRPNEERNFTFLFTKRDFYPDQRLDKLTFTMILANQFSYFPNVSIQVLPSGENKTSFQEKLFHPANISKTQNYGRIKSFELLAEEGTFKITLKNLNSTAPANFTLMLSAREMNFLMPNWETIRFLGLGYNDYYQIYAQNSSLLLIEIFECVGTIQVAATNRYDFLINGVYELAVRRHQANHIALTFEVEEGPVYLGLKGVEGLSLPTKYLDKELMNKAEEEQVLYKLYATVIDRKAGSPYDIYYAGDNSRLTWNMIDDGVQVKVPTVRNSDPKNKFYVPRTYIYKLYLSENELDLDSATRCGGTIPFEFFQKFKTLRFELSLEAEKHNASYIYLNVSKSELQSLGSSDMVYMNIICEVLWNSTELVESSKFIYSGTEVIKSQYMNTNSGSSHGASKIIIIIILLLLILLAIGSMIIFKRYKKMKDRLRFELQDVRNVASLEMNETKIEEVTVKNEKGENRKVLYQGFLEEGV